jgi:hypothetical protein
MSARIQPLNVVDFTGGLNLRADAFQLAPNEAPDMMNVEVDPRGGFYSRKGWVRWNSEEITEQVIWDPRHAFIHELSNGLEVMLLTNNGGILSAVGGVFEPLLGTDGVPIAATANPHLADFASWGDLTYVACGRESPPIRSSGFGGATRLTPAGAGNWSDDYTVPGSNVMPAAELTTAHVGYLFVANTMEDGKHHPNRIRWSHPNLPDAWSSDDYLDVLDGGGRITAIMSFRDHLLIFKPSAVFALFGYDSDSWQLVNVSLTVGAASRQAVCRSEAGVYFFSNPAGVHGINAAGELREVSPQLRPTFESAQFNNSADHNVWLGWVDQHLWFSAPWDDDSSPTDAKTVFKFDPSVGERGAWTKHRTADNEALGPYAEGPLSGLFLAAHRKYPSVLRLGGSDLAADRITTRTQGSFVYVDDNGNVVTDDGAVIGWTEAISGFQPFKSYFVTRWFNSDWPSLKKSWRRPDFVMKERDEPYKVRVDVFHNYDEGQIRRSSFVGVKTGSKTALWGEFDWGDGTLWGGSPAGSRIERGKGLGAASAVALRLEGEPGRAWGCDAMVFKFIPRRFR